MQLAFIGLGVMGFPMAGHLEEAGHQVCVYNRTIEKAKRWVDNYGGAMAPTPTLAAKDAELIFICVGNDADLTEVVAGPDGVFNSLQSGAIIVDHTTASASLARELQTKAQALGGDFLDAPVSGGQSGAELGQLTIMVGGELASFERAKPLMDAFGKAVTHMGPSGNGQLTKMVNQICVAGVVQGLSEALVFGERAGLDMQKAIGQVISQGAAQSWQMDNRYQTMLQGEFDFGFAVDWMRKDLGLVFEEAERNGADLPITQLIDEYYAEVQAMGGGRWDTSSLIQRLRDKS